jgi:aspartate oxidase
MRIIRTIIPALFAAGFLLCLAGCGSEPVFRGSGSRPLSGDVIVVGDSIAGLVAALDAARLGAAVMLFYSETSDDRWVWNEGGVMAEGADKDAVAALRASLEAYGDGLGKSWHYDLLARRSALDLAWLAGETGVLLAYEDSFRYRPDNLSLPQAYERLVEAAAREGVRFFANVTLRELITADDGAVAGLLFESPQGILRAAYARAVILADGGYLGSRSMLDLHAPATIPASWRPVKEATGMGLGMAAGLDLVGENLFSYAPAFAENSRWVHAAWPARTVLVTGNRIIPLDDKTTQDVATELLGSGEQEGYLLVAEAFLGAEHDLPWPGFSGIDAFMEEFGLEFPLLRRWFAEPWGRFLGRPVRAVAEYCLGGLAVNETGEALADNMPVTGLYVVGEAAGGLHGRSLMPGAALSEAVVWGRLVGREAALRAQQ